MLKFILFLMFIDKYFYKNDLWKLLLLFELVGIVFFKEEFEVKEVCKF